MGPIEKLNQFLKPYRDKKILVVSGNTFLKKSLIGQEYLNALSEFPVEFFDKAQPNPKWEEIKTGYLELRDGPYDLIISIGGGSTMDLAKIFFFLQSLEESPENIDPLEISKLSPPPSHAKHLAIPTTFGTGSEVTQFATFYFENKKVSLDSPIIIPCECILDSRFLANAPAHLVARTAMDATSHAIESFWSIQSTEKSREISERALALLWHNIIPALAGQSEAQHAVAEGSHLAGQAIQITRTTACHSMSYPMTSFFNIDHGQATIISVPEVLRFNAGLTTADCLDQRGVDFAKEILQKIASTLGCADVEGAAREIETKIKNIGLKVKLSDLGIRQQDLPKIAENAFTPSRMKNNPRRVSAEDVSQFLQTIY